MSATPTSRWMRWHRARLPELRWTFGMGGWVTRAEWYVDFRYRQRCDADGWTA